MNPFLIWLALGVITTIVHLITSYSPKREREKDELILEVLKPDHLVQYYTLQVFTLVLGIIISILTWPMIWLGYVSKIRKKAE